MPPMVETRAVATGEDGIPIQRSDQQNAVRYSSRIMHIEPERLLRRGFALEGITLAWNVVGVAVLAVAAARARSVALAGFGLDSLVEIGASTVVIWELSGTARDRQRRALRLIGV